MENPREADSSHVPFEAARPLDLICVGRVGVDLYAEQVGSPLREAQSFRMYLGGSPANVAVGSSRLGLDVEMFSRVGSDELGRFLRDTLEREGVGTRLLQDDEDHLSGLVILGIAPPDHFPLIFYRENCADMETRIRSSDGAVLREAKAVLVTGTGLSRTSTAKATLEIVRMARDEGAAIILDVDYRPVLWGLTRRGDGESRYRSSAEVTATIARVLPYVDLLVGTEEEIQIAGGRDDADAAIAAVRESFSGTIVCKRGAAGCSVFSPGAPEQRFEGYPVDIINVLGAGDAFLAGFLRGWLRGETLATCASWANANGALVVSRHGCAPAMATLDELHWFLAQKNHRDAARSPELARIHRRATARSAEDLLVMAFDHRIIFECAADAAGIDRSEISRLKKLIYDGFERAIGSSGDSGCALLIDPLYGADVLAEATKRGRRIGVPIEAAGFTPTRWIDGASAYSLVVARPMRWFVKALFRLHPTQSQELRDAQHERMREVQSACEALDRELMIEIIEPEGLAFAGGEVPNLITECVAAGIEPTWWKLPSVSAGDWRALEDSLDNAGSDARVIVLGGGRTLADFDDAIRVARRSPRAGGFAVGRTVFDDAMKAFFSRAPSDEIPARVAERYAHLISTWRESSTAGGAG